MALGVYAECCFTECHRCWVSQLWPVCSVSWLHWLVENCELLDKFRLWLYLYTLDKSGNSCQVQQQSWFSRKQGHKFDTEPWQDFKWSQLSLSLSSLDLSRVLLVPRNESVKLFFSLSPTLCWSKLVCFDTGEHFQSSLPPARVDLIKLFWCKFTQNSFVS